MAKLVLGREVFQKVQHVWEFQTLWQIMHGKTLSSRGGFHKFLTPNTWFGLSVKPPASPKPHECAYRLSRSAHHMLPPPAPAFDPVFPLVEMSPRDIWKRKKKNNAHKCNLSTCEQCKYPTTSEVWRKNYNVQMMNAWGKTKTKDPF